MTDFRALQGKMPLSLLESSKNSDMLTYKNYSSHPTVTVIKTSLKTTLFQVISSMQENTQIQIVYNYTIVRFKYKKKQKSMFSLLQ